MFWLLRKKVTGLHGHLIKDDEQINHSYTGSLMYLAKIYGQIELEKRYPLN